MASDQPQTTDAAEHVAQAIRVEIVRQYRDDDRGKCPGGAAFYESEVSPYLIARVAIAAYKEWKANGW